MDVTCRPISSWPWPETPAPTRKRAQFKRPARKEFHGGWTSRSDYPVGATVSELKRELTHLRASAVVLELDLREQDLKRDGWPKADARCASPRVVLSFTAPGLGPLRYGTDRYDRWEDNLRAIRLSLEALRAVDRYGVTRRGEQYTGWKALPPAGGTEVTVSAAEAAKILGDFSGVAGDEVLHSPVWFGRAHRVARAKTHPDVNGGRREAWDAVERAAAVLTRHHGQA